MAVLAAQMGLAPQAELPHLQRAEGTLGEPLAVAGLVGVLLVGRQQRVLVELAATIQAQLEAERGLLLKGMLAHLERMAVVEAAAEAIVRGRVEQAVLVATAQNGRRLARAAAAAGLVVGQRRVVLGVLAGFTEAEAGLVATVEQPQATAAMARKA